MKNRHAACFVPRVAIALACICIVGAARGAVQHDSDIESYCLGSDGSRKEVLTVETRLGGVPALLRFPPKIARPPVLLWHGFGPPMSERALLEALPLDDVPALKVYLGLPQFGAREAPNGREDMLRRQKEDLGRLVFEPVVAGAAQELPSVITALQQLSCLREREKVALFGFSAGAAAVLIALADGKVPVEAAVIVNASTGLSASVEAYENVTKQKYQWSGYTRELARRTDAAGRAEDIARNLPALLMLQGKDDSMLTSKNLVALRDALAPYYGNSRDQPRLRLTLIEGLSHGWADSSHIDELRRAIANWYNAG